MSHALAQSPRSMPRRGPTRPGALAALWRDLIGSWRSAIARSREPELDEATLRDLGISRSELASFGAEADGRVQATRLRILQQGSGGY